MTARLRYVLQILATSLWLLPLVGVALAMLLAWLLPALDRMGLAALVRDHGLFKLDAQGARLIFSTIAGSMMTIASLVFSITLLTLTVASQQLGPRLVATFMADRLNQLVLATFLSVFVYSLMAVGSIEDAPRDFVPYGSVAFGVLLTLTSLILLVFYVHHAAASIQADTIISRTGRTLLAIIRNMQQSETAKADPLPEPELAGAHVFIRSRRSGYVEAIEMADLMSLASPANVIIDLRCEPGSFVIERGLLAVVWGTDEAGPLVDKIHRSMALGPKRTTTQDVEFAMRGLVEIALRALSPGINDPYTAIACIDHLAEALAMIMHAPLLPRVLADSSGQVRVLARRPTVQRLISHAFDDIRQAASGNVAVTIRLVDALVKLTEHAGGDEHRHLLAEQGEVLARSAERSVVEPVDRQKIEARLTRLRTALSS